MDVRRRIRRGGGCWEARGAGVGGGVGAAAVTRPIPEREDAYPESTMFGTLPSSGFYCRHVNGLVMENIRIDTVKPDARPALLCEDVLDLHISNCQGNGHSDDAVNGPSR